MALIHLSIAYALTHLPKHGPFALSELRIRVSISFILVNRVKLIELICKADAPERF